MNMININSTNLTSSASDEFVFVGTAKDAEQKGVKLNGKFIDAVTISALSRHGLVEVVGKKEKPKGQRGRIANIFGLKNREGMVFTISD